MQYELESPLGKTERKSRFLNIIIAEAYLFSEFTDRMFLNSKTIQKFIGLHYSKTKQKKYKINLLLHAIRVRKLVEVWCVC